ncbi:MAG TPA: HlyD family efflux transporter periplasmic adaptor subunit [Hyphomicrobiales bacterium]|nr:HlyD family efflux transporter periplasmic adaptor subunit [Rhodobiaceae bacterium]HXK53998.1 HlyD family efflux transporter periplasmic adaptor subunit [Hyphomicrobiales bacterium]
MKLRLIAAALAMAGLLAACSENGGTIRYTGYVEGKYVAVAPREAARIAEIAVSRGERVEKGQVVARLEEDDARAALAQAQAELERARAELTDLFSGKRKEEIAVTRAQLDEAEAGLKDAGQTLERQRELFQRKIASDAALDQAQAANDRAQARVEALKREIAAQSLPAREQAIAAARARADAQTAALALARWKLEQRVVTAPAGGIVDEVLRREGEMASPEGPVLSILPDGNRVVRFFVPEAGRAMLAPGQAVTLSCDGCGDGLAATISYIAAQAEYTPPVIYSVESRRKLVFMIEAEPQGDAALLSPGQPVEVILNAGAAQ